MKRLIFSLALLLALHGTAQAQDAAATKVMDCARANIPKSLTIREFELTAVDRVGGSRTLKGRIYAIREDNLLRAMIKMTAPADMARSSFLVREGKDRDDMWIYLPALDRVRRITGAGTGGPLFGTDISYSDVKQMENAFSGGIVHSEKDSTLQGRPMYVLRLTPTRGEDSRYSQVRGWIDQKTCVPLQVDFYEGSEVRKRLSGNAADLKQDHAHWYLTKSRMSDLKDGTHTDLDITGVTSDNGLSSRYFSSQTFSTAD
ncbi:MAG: outer membrane lipoprotein-sorting protein [Stenotrophobium sp.]